MLEPQPAFSVNGLHDLSIINPYAGATTLSYFTIPVSVTYNDSTQSTVTLSLSSLPPGISMDTTWITSGIPTYTTTITLYDTTANGATPGVYPMTLTASSATSGKKTFSFNIKIANPPSCTSYIVGSYNSCTTTCGTGGDYADNVTNDPSVVNKIWFSNFGNKGISVYGFYNCSFGEITIPSQTVGGITLQGSASTSGHHIYGSYYSNTSSCSINMD